MRFPSDHQRAGTTANVPAGRAPAFTFAARPVMRCVSHGLWKWHSFHLPPFLISGEQWSNRCTPIRALEIKGRKFKIPDQVGSIAFHFFPFNDTPSDRISVA
jgi:hypothetical protein